MRPVFPRMNTWRSPSLLSCDCKQKRLFQTAWTQEIAFDVSMTGERVQSADFTCGWGVLSGLQRPHEHTSREGSFCVEYWYARPLQSISSLMRCDAVPLSCWNRFLRKTGSIFSLLPLSVFSVFSIFPAVLLRVHDSDLGSGLKGDSVFQYQSVLCSDLTLDF